MQAQPAAGRSTPGGLSRLRIEITHARLIFLLLTLGYCATFYLVYVDFVAEYFATLGFGFQAKWAASDVAFVVLLSVAPALWMPTAFDRSSVIFLHLQYFLIYIPAIWMTRHSTLPILDSFEQADICTNLALGMAAMIFLQRRLPLLRLSVPRIPAHLMWIGVYFVALALLLALVASLGGNFRLVSIYEIYSLRADASDKLEASGNGFATYAFFWLNGLLLPMIFAHAVRREKYLQVGCVFGAYVFLFGIWGSKTSLLSPLLLPAAYYWTTRSPQRMPRYMLLSFMLLLSIPEFLPFEEGSVGYLVKLGFASIIDMRTFSIPGLALPQYYGFFSTHPLTLGSHVTGINWFINYPYDNDIPRTVGYYFYGDQITANANFWAQDGFAALGSPGVIVMSLIAAGVLWLVDSVTAGLPMKFIVPSLTGVFLAFTNVSIFTTLMTGGLGLFCLFCAFLPRDPIRRAAGTT